MLQRPRRQTIIRAARNFQQARIGGMDLVPSGTQYQTPAYTNAGGTGDRRAIITVTFGNNVGAAAPQAWSGDVSAWVDGTKTDQIYSTNPGVNASIYGYWIEFDFGHLVKVDKVKRYGGDVQGTGKWQTSIDDSAWADVSGSILYDATNPHEEAITGTMPFRYLRLLYTGTPLIGGAAYVNEYEFSIGNPL